MDIYLYLYLYTYYSMVTITYSVGGQSYNKSDVKMTSYNPATGGVSYSVSPTAKPVSLQGNSSGTAPMTVYDKATGVTSTITAVNGVYDTRSAGTVVSTTPVKTATLRTATSSVNLQSSLSNPTQTATVITPTTTQTQSSILNDASNYYLGKQLGIAYAKDYVAPTIQTPTTTTKSSFLNDAYSNIDKYAFGGNLPGGSPSNALDLLNAATAAAKSAAEKAAGMAAGAGKAMQDLGSGFSDFVAGWERLITSIPLGILKGGVQNAADLAASAGSPDMSSSTTQNAPSFWDKLGDNVSSSMKTVIPLAVIGVLAIYAFKSSNKR